MTRERAVILPTPGDPFLLHYWMILFFRWEKYIDKLYVVLNDAPDIKVREYFNHLFDHPKVELVYYGLQKGHGEAINAVLDSVKEKHLMLIEDDGFIFWPCIVENCFHDLEDNNFPYEVVGGKRGSCGNEILEAAKAKWGLDYRGLGDQGPNFWPCFFFCHTELLKKTDRNFGSRMWKAGEYCKELDYTFKQDTCGDTFVNTSLQIRNIVPENKIKYVNQYHAHPDDLEHFGKREFLFDGKAMWTHIGSLSSGWGGVLKEDAVLDKKMCQTDAEHKEWERRVQVWLSAWENRETGHLVALADKYRYAIDRVVSEFRLDINKIKRRQEVYRTYLTLP